MDIFPAIDIIDGKAVRLFQGDYNQKTVFSSSPEQVAEGFKKAGAEYLHLVDLDGAKSGETPNSSLICALAAKTGLKAQVGGGIRHMKTIEKYLSGGIFRVILGTAAVNDEVFLKEALSNFGERIAVGVDMRNGVVATHGWTQSSNMDGFDFCSRLEQQGVKTIICTDISRDGAMQGVNIQLYQRLCSHLGVNIIASGGVTDYEDIRSLKKLGVSGVILGKALYTGSLDLGRVIELSEGKNDN